MPLKCLDMWKRTDEDMRRQGVSDEERRCQMDDSDIRFPNWKRKILPLRKGGKGEELYPISGMIQQSAQERDGARKALCPHAPFRSWLLASAHRLSEQMNEWVSKRDQGLQQSLGKSETRTCTLVAAHSPGQQRASLSVQQVGFDGSFCWPYGLRAPRSFSL